MVNIFSPKSPSPVHRAAKKNSRRFYFFFNWSLFLGKKMYVSLIETTEEKKENMRNKFSLSDLFTSPFR